MPKVYKYRNLPCSISKKPLLFAVIGVDNHNRSYGVLEWCYDEVDAKEILNEMKKYDQFDALRIQSWD